MDMFDSVLIPYLVGTLFLQDHEDGFGCFCNELIGFLNNDEA